MAVWVGHRSKLDKSIEYEFCSSSHFLFVCLSYKDKQLFSKKQAKENIFCIYTYKFAKLMSGYSG